MKKLLSFIILSALLLSGCGTESASNAVANPYEIKVGDKVLSMYDSSKEDFEENGFEAYEYLGGTFDENNSITYHPNNNNGVSGIRIYSDDIVTYKSISVGNDIEKLKKSFDNLYINEYETGCTIYFDPQGKEMPALGSKENIDENDKGTFIGYYLDENSIITQILINDTKLLISGT